MELTDNDKQRIEQEVRKSVFADGQYDGFIAGAEYATIHEREQFEQERKDAYNAGLMCERILAKDEIEKLEAERSEVIRRIKSILKASTVHDKISIIEELEQLLNSLKTK